jgi:hypothetical protein
VIGLHAASSRIATTTNRMEMRMVPSRRHFLTAL